MRGQFPSWWLRTSWQSQLLTPLSWLFGGLSRLRQCYQQYWCQPYQSHVPFIVVGNVMLGGTGKTPMVLHLVGLCRSAGLRVAIISKGYGGTYTARYKQPLLVEPQHVPKEVGDEPSMMASAQLAPVIIAYRRSQAIEWIAEHYPQVHCIISDDGLNDYSVRRDMEIVMIDGMRGLGNQKLLPAGPLREPQTRLLSADYIIMTQPKTRLSTGIYHHTQMALEGDMAINMYNQKKKPLSFFADKKTLAIAGIGNPERYFTHLKRYVPLLQTKSFADHHDYSQTVLPANCHILMTSKDAVKFGNTVADNYWEVPVVAKLSEEFNETITQRLTTIAMRYTSRQ